MLIINQSIERIIEPLSWASWALYKRFSGDFLEAASIRTFPVLADSMIWFQGKLAMTRQGMQAFVIDLPELGQKFHLK